MTSGIFRELVKALLAEGALALLVIYSMQLRHGLRRRVWVTGLVLVLVAAGAVAAYLEFGWKRYGTYMNNHDFYHYYTGTKYAPELGYFNQYAASLLADHEQDKVYDAGQPIRNLENHGYRATAEVFAEQDAIKGRFTPERWEDFKQDIYYFRDRVPDAKWQQMLRDKGYNGTPVWSMTTGLLTNAIGTDNEAGINLLIALDPILLALMFAAVWWAFGPWTALFAIAFFGTNFVTNFVHIKGALLRMDWVACLVISMCLLHKKHFKTAGVVLAYAAAARVFPVVFAFGLGALACWELLLTRRINRDYVRFFATFTLTVALLAGLSYLYYGSALWGEFIAKIGVHNADISTTRVGFKYIFLWPFENFGAKVDGFKAHQSLWWQFQAGALALTFLAARRMTPYQALGLGFVPAFFLTAPTFYYYVMLIVPLLVFLPDLTRPGHVIGAGLFFATSLVAYGLSVAGFNLDFPLSFYLSCMYGLIGLYMVGLYLLPARLFAPRTSAPPEPLAEADVPEGLRVAPQDTATVVLPRTVPQGTSITARVLGVAYASFIIALFFMYRSGPAPVVREEPAAPVEASRPAPPDREEARVPVTPAAGVAAPTPTARPLPEPVEPAAAAAPGESVTIAFVGDIMLARNVERDLKQRDLDFTYPFVETAPMLLTADIAFGNLECPISGRGEPLEKRYLFNARPESVAGLTHAGFDVLSLANNHILDYGLVAQEDTIRILGENGLAPLGIATGDAPQSPVILERNGLRIGFLGYADPETPYAYATEFLPFETGPAKATTEALARDIAALKASADLIVVSLHWGIEYEAAPNARQIELGQFSIDQGAHIVAGHHPHVQQDAAWYKGGLIIYSLGNFVFDQWSRPATRESRLYTVTLTKDGPVHAQYRPLEIVQKDWQPRPTGPQYVHVPRPAE